MRLREFHPGKDTRRVEELERLCGAGPSGSVSLFADSMGNPQGRACLFQINTMLVAEIGDEIVGVIRAGIKDMVCGTRRIRNGVCKESPIVARAVYILGLRVSPLHRRKGIGLELSRRAESWGREQGAMYAYMLTDRNNSASTSLFIDKLQFNPVRTPSILGHPVFQHRESIPSHIRLTPLSPADASSLYTSCFSTTDFFPADIDSILASKLCAGTWLATLRQESHLGSLLPDQIPLRKLLQGSFSSWAVLSVWNTGDIFKLQVCGVPWRKRALAAASRAVDRSLPCLGIASFPDIFRPFGVHFLFGAFAQGPRGGELLAGLCKHSRNVARGNGARVVVTELGCDDPLLGYIPRWKKLSSMDDLCCVKDLTGAAAAATVESDWIRNPDLGSRVFVDPRDV